MNRGMNNAWTFVLACAVVYGTYCLLMGVIPGAVWSGVSATPGVKPLTADEVRGRDVYVSEGCSYCHTQTVRPLVPDKIFGRPSVAGDYAYDTPQLLGTERTGPDLANVGARQPSDVWQYIHLWDPRAVVHDSIMPRYTWLFKVKDKAAPGDVTVPLPPGFAPARGVVVTTPQVRDLVEYLESRKQVSLGGGAAK